ncbi:MAG: hypothetical protein KDC34_13000 [Saprospiraceae bacterium]|nr:hypothetical protein [Saprospiraceae bacterium]
MLDYTGLIFEIVFLAIGVYVYLFARGVISFKDPAARARSEEFRKENGRILRILALALIAVMGMNIAIHLYSLVKS